MVQCRYDSGYIKCGYNGYDNGRLCRHGERVKAGNLNVIRKKTGRAGQNKKAKCVRVNVIILFSKNTRLPEKTKRIRITIKDVYKGDKYDDTCLSSILVTDPNAPSFEEQKAQIRKLLETTGVIKEINKFTGR